MLLQISPSSSHKSIPQTSDPHVSCNQTHSPCWFSVPCFSVIVTNICNKASKRKSEFFSLTTQMFQFGVGWTFPLCWAKGLGGACEAGNTSHLLMKGKKQRNNLRVSVSPSRACSTNLPQHLFPTEHSTKIIPYPKSIIDPDHIFLAHDVRTFRFQDVEERAFSFFQSYQQLPCSKHAVVLVLNSKTNHLSICPVPLKELSIQIALFKEISLRILFLWNIIPR